MSAWSGLYTELRLSFLQNKWWIVVHFKEPRPCVRPVLMLFLYKTYTDVFISVKCGSTRLHAPHFPPSPNSGLQTWLNIALLTTLWPQSFFFFIVCKSSFSTQYCCCPAERIWNIYQGIMCWRHKFYGNVAGVWDKCVQQRANSLSAKTVFMVFGMEWHKHSFWLTSAERRTLFLWRRAFTTRWFKMQLLSSRMWIQELEHSDGRFSILPVFVCRPTSEPAHRSLIIPP